MVDAKRNRWIEPSTFGVGALLVLALVVMVNYLSWKHYKRFDWTSQELYSLSDKSKNVVRGLERPIEAVVFMSPGEQLFEPVRELLTRYAAESPNFDLRLVDPQKNLAEAQQLVDQYALSHLDVIVFDAGDDRRVIESADLADYDYSGLQAGLGPELTGFKGEQAFTGAIIDISQSRKPRIAFTVGHGELRLDDNSARGLTELAGLLGTDNFEIEEWLPLAEQEVPEGTDIVVIAGPTAGFAENEVNSIERFLAGGGRLLALLDPVLGAGGAVTPTGLDALLSKYGVELGSDIVIDPENPLPFFGAETFFVTDFGEHPITEPLRQAEVPVIIPLARSLRLADETAGTSGTVLLSTSPDGWGERDLTNLGAVGKDSSDVPGPVAVAVAVEALDSQETVSAAEADGNSSEEAFGDTGDTADTADSAEASLDETEPSVSEPTKTRLIVFGDADFLTNGQLRNVGNAELAANTLNWMVERENLIAIPPKKPEQVRLTLSAGELRSVGILVFLVLPGLALVAGAAIYSRRRR